MNQSGFRTVRSGRDARTVLAIDSGLGMAQASFQELAALLETEWTVRESVPGSSLDDWLAEINRSGYDIRGVLGYCSGSSLAGALADRVIERGWSNPGVVLFDPVPVNPRELWFIFNRFVDAFTELMDEDTIARARTLVREAVHRHGPDLIALTAELRVGYEHTIRAAAEPAGLHEQIIEDFVDRFDAELDFMLAATEHPLSPRHAEVAVIYSSDWTESEIEAASRDRVEVPRAELLSSPEVAAATMRALTACGTTGSVR